MPLPTLIIITGLPCSAKFLEIKRTFAYAPLQILCHAEGGVLRKRFEQRSLRGERHPGHLDALLSKELESLLLGGRAAPLDVGGRLIEVDTTDFGRQNLVAVLKTVRSVMDPE
jgi:hypothetical protein